MRNHGVYWHEEAKYYANQRKYIRRGIAPDGIVSIWLAMRKTRSGQTGSRSGRQALNLCSTERQCLVSSKIF